MALNLNVTPYFDDYDINKGYLKILFKPGNSVQAREMTQMQSLLQKQIANLSDHFFKDGAIGLTKSLGKELADKNIAVNAVTPAGARTRILDQMTKEHVQRMLSKVPRGRFLEVEEFTSLICWLSSEENTFSTAAVFDISGGRSTY